jgi:hypothetical protein
LDALLGAASGRVHERWILDHLSCTAPCFPTILNPKQSPDTDFGVRRPRRQGAAAIELVFCKPAHFVAEDAAPATDHT